MKTFEDRAKETLDSIYESIKEFDPDITDTFGIVDWIIQLFKKNLPEYHLEEIVESTIEESDESEQ